MPRRKPELTWQQESNRAPRWRKVYRGRVFKAPGGNGRSDNAAYQAALSAFMEWKTAIDAELDGPLDKQYADEIANWERVLDIAKRNDEDDMAEIATKRIGDLHAMRVAKRPPPFDERFALDAYFTPEVRAARSPSLDWSSIREAWVTITKEHFKREGRELPKDFGVDDCPLQADPESQAWHSPTGVRAEWATNPDRIYSVEEAVWKDRLDRDGPKVEADQTLAAHVDRFMAGKQSEAAAGALTLTRVHTVSKHLQVLL